MKAWSAASAGELKDWPQIALRSFFGFMALYRGRKMFGLLPRTRSVFQNNAVAFRIEGATRRTRALVEKDRRIAAFNKDRARWFTFELSSDRDLRDALEYFARAFDAARSAKKTK